MRESLGIDAAASLQSSDQPWQRCKLLEHERLAPDWINWRLWLEQIPASPLANCPRINCRNYTQTIAAARQGEGLALDSRGLIDNELQADILRVLGDVQLETGRACYLSQPGKKHSGSATIALKQLLMSAPVTLKPPMTR